MLPKDFERSDSFASPQIVSWWHGNTFNPETQFADSDDEDEDNVRTAQKKKAKVVCCDDEYSGSLSVKNGRNANTTLYYCDYSKLSNNGNGLPPDERNTLLSDHEAAKAEMQAHNNSIQSMNAETLKLLSEPTNEEATTDLDQAEAYSVELQEKVQAAQELKSFEKHRIKVNKRIGMDFLLAMEDNTDGTISVKKCLAGDGQIYIGKSRKFISARHGNHELFAQMIFFVVKESDKAAIKGQMEYAVNMKRRGLPAMQPKKKQKLDKNELVMLPADESFVGVDLNANGIVERVYLESWN